MIRAITRTAHRSMVLACARRFLNDDSFTLFENLSFGIRERHFDVDQIVISQYGVSVITMMNLPGSITVSGSLWYQWDGREYLALPSPLDVSRTRASLVAEILGLDDNHVQPYLVLFRDSSFENETPDGVYIGVDYIREIKRRFSPVMSLDECLRALDLLILSQHGPDLPERCFL